MQLQNATRQSACSVLVILLIVHPHLEVHDFGRAVIGALFVIPYLMHLQPRLLYFTARGVAIELWPQCEISQQVKVTHS